MTPHHPAADRLPACDACGAPSEPYTASQPHYTIFAKRGCGDVVHLCLAHQDERTDKTAEQILARRRSLTTPPASASEKFNVGDRVRSKVTGKDIGVIESINGLVAFTSDGGQAGWHVGNLEAASAQRIESEYYGTQPDPLPETLPAGTTYMQGEWRLLSEARLKLGDQYEYDAWERVRDGHRPEHANPGRMPADKFDWKAIPKPASPGWRPEVGDWVKVTKNCDPSISAATWRIVSVTGSSGIMAVSDDHVPDGRWDKRGKQGLKISVEHHGVRPSTPTTAAGSAESATSNDAGLGAGNDARRNSSARPAAVDLYEKHRRDNYGEASISARQSLIDRAYRNGAYLKPPTDELDRLAARRARHLSECRASLESDGKARAEAVRHASDWDVDDAPELFATSGWSGR